MVAVALPRNMTVNDAIRMYPRTVELFQHFGIDACCGGAVPISTAAARHGVDVEELMRQLVRIVQDGA